VSPAKTGKPIEMPFWGLTRVGPRNIVLDGEGQNRTNPFTSVTSARRNQSAMQPFAKLLWTL